MNINFKKSVNLAVAMFCLLCNACHSSAVSEKKMIADNSEQSASLNHGIQLDLGTLHAKLSQKDWLSKLNATGKCETQDASTDERYVALYTIDSTTYLLSLACTQGAYQDGHLVFLVKTKPDAELYFPLTWLTPMSNDGNWTLETQQELIGNFIFDSPSLEVNYRSNGAGTCGSIAQYQLTDINPDKPIAPISAKGQADCFAGEAMDEWSVLSFSYSK